MIQIENVSFQYNNSEKGALKDVSISVDKGECVLLCGASGCGKTTITRLINGLIPHFYEGEYSGNVSVYGMNVQSEELYNISKKVGSVFQNPRSQFFCMDTTSEVAFGCENMGLVENDINERVKLAVSELEMENLMDRDIFKLSGGEKQRVACGSVTAMQPDVFVLDEPTSNLDKESIERLKNTLLLWKKQGKTIVIAEHRLYWLKEICDRVVYLEHGRIMFDITMQEFLKFSEQKLQNLGLRTMQPHCDESSKRHEYIAKKSDIVLKNYYFSYGEKKVLEFGDMQLPKNELIAITGQNGAGKSTTLNAVAGVWPIDSGSIIIDGVDMTGLSEHKRAPYLGRVFQDPMNGTAATMEIIENLALAARRGQRRGLKWGVTKSEKKKYREMLAKLDLGLEDRMTSKVGLLSGGQRQALTLLMATIKKPKLLLLDEHTAALDPKTAAKVLELSDKIIADNHLTAMMVTHNMRDAIIHGNRLIMMNEGKVILDIKGEEKKKLTVEDLLQKFEEVSGEEFSNDKALLG